MSELIPHNWNFSRFLNGRALATRRSFFKKLAGIAAVVALAPEIAFARKLELPAAVWEETSLHVRVYSDTYLRWRSGWQVIGNGIVTQPDTTLNTPYHDTLP